MRETPLGRKSQEPLQIAPEHLPPLGVDVRILSDHHEVVEVRERDASSQFGALHAPVFEVDLAGSGERAGVEHVAQFVSTPLDRFFDHRWLYLDL